MATLSAKSQAQLADERKAREDRAYDLSGERERRVAGEPIILATARKLHYCVRMGMHEDAYGHIQDLLRRLFEYGSGTPLVEDLEYEPADPPICHAAQLVDALAKIEGDTEPAISRGYVRLLALLRVLFF
jgi:hypothetical protein